MKKTVLTLSCLALMLFGVKAEDDIKNEALNPLFTGVPFLSIAPDARAGGMGDVGAATSPDIYSQHWNPSKYAFMESPAGFAFSYTPWLNRLVNDINLSYVVGYWKPDEMQSISASFKYFSLGKVTLNDGQGTHYDANPNDFSIDLAYSRKLSETFSASVGFRYIRSDLDVGAWDNTSGGEMTPSNNWAVDISAYWRKPIMLAYNDAFLGIGGSITNLGNKVSYDDGETKNFLPTNLRIGASFEYPFDNFNRLSINFDANKLLIPTPAIANDGSSTDKYQDISVIKGLFQSFSDASFKEEMQEIMWSVGLEYSYNQQFFVRGGYFHESDYKGGRQYFTAGVGFKLNVFQLDAGYVIAKTAANPLDNTLRFSLSFDLFGLKNLLN